MQEPLVLQRHKDRLQRRMTMSFGAALRRLRKRKRLTLQQVAEIVGVKYPAVQQWETDKTLPQRDKIDALAGILGADVGYIWPRPGRSFEIEIDEDVLNQVIYDYEETKQLEDEAELLGRVPFRYANHAKSIKSSKSSLESAVRNNRNPDTYDHIYVFDAKSTSGNRTFEIGLDRIGYTTKPDAIGMIKFPFAFYMPDASMSPKFESGQFIICDDVPVQNYSGYALACKELADPNCMVDCRVLKIVSMDSVEIIGYALNPIEHIRLLLADGFILYRILEVSDLVDDLTPQSMKARLR